MGGSRRRKNGEAEVRGPTGEQRTGGRLALRECLVLRGSPGGGWTGAAQERREAATSARGCGASPKPRAHEPGRLFFFFFDEGSGAKRDPVADLSKSQLPERETKPAQPATASVSTHTTPLQPQPSMLFDDGAVTPAGLVLACVDCARFDPADPLARLLALASMAPYAMVLCLAAVRFDESWIAFYCIDRKTSIHPSEPLIHQIVYATRHPEAAAVLAAGCANEALSLILKKIIRQPRPHARCVELATCGKAGMPSSHAQSVLFAVAVHGVLAAGVRREAALEGVVLSLAAVTVCVARVYLGYHTPAQVVVGGVLGAALGVAVGRAVKAGRHAGRARRKRVA